MTTRMRVRMPGWLRTSLGTWLRMPTWLRRPGVRRIVVRGAATLLPVSAVLAVYAWTHWSLAGSSASPPPTAVAVVVGLVIGVGSMVVCFRLRPDNGGCFGALFLAMALLATVAAADARATRSGEAVCVVREATSREQGSHGEGGPPTRTVHRVELRCPGGYPTALKDDKAMASKGEKIRVAYDPRRQVSPEIAGRSTPWGAFVATLVLTAITTLLAAWPRKPERDRGDRAGR
ncbi:hypothetical protein DSC45_02820 [Streptomyces sp. YIM 130001]|uniref:hypothetical protein n=1 Tax=Streptomyces sp. YIM 130001 TaxID=2259644 RepID=UPI000EBDBD11|nr:hypothetical protein [Streptomyces sp. YIM 130001]RII20754.1 hypothetical protein DSC45_02820 [Streptomyces sp. YIM 130001]